jgi:tRNA modification GTPase
MNAYAAVMTGKGGGAIATVCVIGEGASDVLNAVFYSISKSNVQFEIGKILLGTIIDGEKVIDQVVIGCEGENEFAINCHGNPLIVEMIMELLAKNGAEPVTTEQFFKSKIQNSKSKIAIEARLVQLKTKTLEGYKLLQNQIGCGLPAKAAEWIKTESLATIQEEASEVLKASQAAQYIIHGCKVVLAGPANSGKSTLLNCLAGKDKSIVADIPGTTRDWVSAHCISGSLAMEIVDTAGLDESLTADNAIDKTAQQKSVELVGQADVVIWVVDGSDEKSNSKNQIAKIQIKNLIVVINKCDLGLKIDSKPEQTVVISAKNGTGIDELTKKIRTVLGVDGFDLKRAVCFTDRQQRILEQLCKSDNKSATHSLVTELLNGSICV